MHTHTRTHTQTLAKHTAFTEVFSRDVLELQEVRMQLAFSVQHACDIADECTYNP